MGSNFKLSNNYAQALLSSVGKSKAEQALVDIEQFAIVWKEQEQLRALALLPTVAAGHRTEAFRQILQKSGYLKEVISFLMCLLKNRRLNQIDEIVRIFESGVEALLGRGRAEIISAQELDSSTRKELEQKLAGATGLELFCHYSQEPALIGGFLVRSGYSIYDCTVQSQLNSLKNSVAEMKVR